MRHFDLISKVRKAVMVNKFLLSGRSFVIHALRSVNVFSTMKNVFDIKEYVDTCFLTFLSILVFVTMILSRCCFLICNMY